MNRALSVEVARQLNFLAGFPSGHTTMTSEDAKEMLVYTGGNMLACGRLYDIVARNIGAGVYRINLTLANP